MIVKFRRMRRGEEQGSVLILALVFLALFGTVVALMLSFGNVSFKLNTSEATRSHQLYAADGVVQKAIADLTTNDPLTAGVCPTAMQGAGQNYTSAQMSLPSDVSTVNVKCGQLTGPGTNTFGGYAVVAGVNLNGNGTYSVNGATGCTSISSDPVGSGAPTYATSVGNNSRCMKYPAGGTPPSWALNVTPYGATIQGTFALSSTEQWFVGTKATGTVPFVWFSNDGDDYADASGVAGNTFPSTFRPVKVWAADATHVFVVGTDTTTGLGAVWRSANSESAPNPAATVTWNQVTLPAGVKTLTDIYGLPGQADMVWATGLSSSNLASVWFFNGLNWVLAPTVPATGFASSTAATGVWAAPSSTNPAVNNVWVSGALGGHGEIWFYNGVTSTWTATTITGGSGSTIMNDVHGFDATHVWAVGTQSGSPTKGIVVPYNTSTGLLNTTPTTVSGTTSLSAVIPASANQIWAAGANSGAAAIACNAPGTTVSTPANPATDTEAPTCFGGVWRAEVLPTVSMPGLNDVSGIKITNGTTKAFILSAAGPGAAGVNGTVLVYAPLAGRVCNIGDCLAQVKGPVFNGNGLNPVSGLEVTTGAFTQYQTAACPAVPVKPNNLVVPAPGSPTTYNCKNTLPSEISTLSRPLPTAKPAATTHPQGQYVGPSGSCTSGYFYFEPGTYTQEIDFQPHMTYFFESGIYLIEGTGSAGGAGFGPFDNLSTPPTPLDQQLYVIGGKPSPGDVPQVADRSPCWSAIQANSAVWNGGSGTGVTFIMAKQTWMDIHTVNLELFTRAGGPASEGAQGLSVRDVSGINSGPWLSDINNRQIPNMVLQVDANDPLHWPTVYIHGGIFLPNENVEEYTNPQPGDPGPTLGPIFANSIEFSFGFAFNPPLIVSPGSPGSPTAFLTVTAGSVTIQVYVPFDETGHPVYDPTKGYSYRVLSPT